MRRFKWENFHLIRYSLLLFQLLIEFLVQIHIIRFLKKISLNQIMLRVYNEMIP
jgi:hypothetical protein